MRLRRFPCQALGVCKREDVVTMQRDGILVVEAQTVGERRVDGAVPWLAVMWADKGGPWCSGVVVGKRFASVSSS